jgi:hypothetical protein
MKDSSVDLSYLARSEVPQEQEKAQVSVTVLSLEKGSYALIVMLQGREDKGFDTTEARPTLSYQCFKEIGVKKLERTVPPRGKMWTRGVGVLI